MDAPAPPDPLAEQFVRELLCAGMGMADALGSLIESLDETGPEPFPGEETAEVLLRMSAGSVQPVIRRADPEAVEAAIELIGAVYDRFVGDLRLAAEISGRRERMGA